MTEIPQHLLRRVQDAREGANPGILPHLLDAGSVATTEPDEHDTFNWSRFGGVPAEIAKKVFKDVSAASGTDGYASVVECFGDTKNPTELYVHSQLLVREIGEGLYLRLGHARSLEAIKDRSTRIMHGLRFFGKDFFENYATRERYREARGTDTHDSVSLGEFMAVAQNHTVVCDQARPWADLIVDTNGRKQPGRDMLTAFGIQTTRRLRNNGYEDFGGSAQVIFPITAKNGLRHKGYYTAGSLAEVEDDGELYLGGHSNPNRGMYSPHLWVGGHEVEWEAPSKRDDYPPTVTDVVNAALSGIVVLHALMQTEDVAAVSDKFNANLHEILNQVN